MIKNRIAVLTSKNSWFLPYARKMVGMLKNNGFEAKLFFRHEDISGRFETVFILSYFRIVDKASLKKHRHNIVVHESDLPKGRGWSPLFWQVLEGKKKVPITLFEASEKADRGRVYIKDHLLLNGCELHDEIRKIQADKTIDLCMRFIRCYRTMKGHEQKGKATYYRKRGQDDSELDINKTLKGQFDILRITDNGSFPAFFHYKGHKYVLRIYKEEI